MEVDFAEAQSHVYNHAFRYIHSMTLRCAIQLGIPDIIDGHGRPMKLPELVSALSIHPDRSNFIQRIMRILVYSGFFALRKIDGVEGGRHDEEDEGYVLTLASTSLLKGNSSNISPMVLFQTDPNLMINPFHNMSKWLYHDNIPTAFMETNKQHFWDFGGQDQEKNRLINEAMASDTNVVANALIDKCRATFESATSLVDVAGGTGGLAGAIAKEFTHLDCTVFDLPHVVKGLKGDNNLSFVAGDMFVAIPPSNLLLLKWILHDWSDEKSIEILKRCREAITQNENSGKVVIIDIVIQNDKKLQQQSHEESGFTETKLLFDMLMMVTVGGKERNEQEWARLFRDAGFSNYKITPFVGFRSLIEVFP